MKKLVAITLICTVMLGNIPLKAKKKDHHKPDRGFAYAKIAVGTIIGLFGTQQILAGSCGCACFCCFDNPMDPCKAMVFGIALLFPAGFCVQSGMKDLNTLEKIKQQKLKEKRKHKQHHTTMVHN